MVRAPAKRVKPIATSVRFDPPVKTGHRKSRQGRCAVCIEPDSKGHGGMVKGKGVLEMSGGGSAG